LHPAIIYYAFSSLEKQVSHMEGWSQLWHTTRTAFVASAWRRNEFESGGDTRCAGKIFLVMPLHFFDLEVQLVVLVSAFVTVSTVWPVYCLLFFCSRCPRALWSRHHCLWLCSGWQW